MLVLHARSQEAAFRGIVVSGPPERPEAVFRAESGSLTPTAVPREAPGMVRVPGFRRPGRREWQSARVAVSGSFTAVRERDAGSLDSRRNG